MIPACATAFVNKVVVSDAIIPNETGLLTPIRNVEKLADALQWLIEHPKERAAMGRALAEREFAIEKIMDQHMRIYRELWSKY